MKPNIRTLEPTDNTDIELIIRSVLTEFGANRPGFAWQDPELSCLSSAYQKKNSHYWIAEENNIILGGCGIHKLEPSIKDTCELQKMYLLPGARGRGIGSALIAKALEFAAHHYRWCYLETLNTMEAAIQLYKKEGFTELPKPLISTEHSSCDRWFIRTL